MEDIKINEEVNQIEEYYWDETESEEAVNSKNFNNRCKALEMMLKVQNQQKQLELDSKKLDFEIEQAKLANEIEKQKLEIQKETNNIEAGKAEAEKAAAKKEHRLGIVKIICSIGGIIASVVLGIWSLITTMKFEETGTVRTSAGKLAQGIAKGAMAKLENCKKDL